MPDDKEKDMTMEQAEEDILNEEVSEETVPEAEKAPETEEAAGTEEETEAAETEAETEAESTEEEAAQEAEGEEEAPSKGKRFWQKQSKAPKKDKKDEKIEELSDRVMRQMAEFDNYRKRTEKEKAQNYMIGAKDVLEKLLPVVDNFERGLANADLTDPFADGIDKVYKQMMTILDGIGVKPIEAVGKEFDPNFHNAVMHIDDENFGENTVAEEFQKGYMYKDQVLRHSMVKVAN